MDKEPEWKAYIRDIAARKGVIVRRWVSRDFYLRSVDAAARAKRSFLFPIEKKWIRVGRGNKRHGTETMRMQETPRTRSRSRETHIRILIWWNYERRETPLSCRDLLNQMEK